MLGGDVSSNCENCFDGVRDREDSLGGLGMVLLTSAVAGCRGMQAQWLRNVEGGGEPGRSAFTYLYRERTLASSLRCRIAPRARVRCTCV